MGKRHGRSVASGESENIRFTSGVSGCGKVTRCNSHCLETVPPATASLDSPLELVLRNGERLRIGSQVVATTLRMVLEVVRG